MLLYYQIIIMWRGKEIPQSCSNKIPRIFIAPQKNPCTSVYFRNAIIIPCNILLSFKNTKSLLIYYNSSKIYVYKYIFLFSILVAFAGQLIFTLLLSPFIEVLIYYLGPFVDWVTFRKKKITNTYF